MRNRIFLCSILFGLMSIFFTPFAFAIDINHFHPSADGSGLLSLYSTYTLTPRSYTTGIAFNFAKEPFSYDSSDLDKAVDKFYSGNLLFCAGVLERLELMIDLAFAKSSGNGVKDFSEQELSAYGLGDMRFLMKASLLKDGSDPLGVAVLPFISLPTGDESTMLGVGTPYGGGILALEKSIDRFRLLVNGGYFYRHSEQIVENVSLSSTHALTYGGGLDIDLIQEGNLFSKLELIAEVYGSMVNNHFEELSQDIITENQLRTQAGSADLLVNPFASLSGTGKDVPLEALGALRLKTDSDLSFTLGGGAGLSDTLGTPVFRVFAGIKFAFSNGFPEDRTTTSSKQPIRPAVPTTPFVQK